MCRALGVVEEGYMRGKGSLLVGLFALAVLALSLSACGGSSPDEFVGTWRQPDYKTVWSAPLVIAKAGDGYRATMVFSQAQPSFGLTRDGDKLSGTMTIGAGDVAVEIVYRPQSGDITFSNAKSSGGSMAKPVSLVKASTSTAIVTPSPF
jgi:hypothetical protein